MVKKVSLFLATLLVANILVAQVSYKSFLKDEKYAIKVQPFMGSYLDKGTHFDKFQPFAPSGVHMGLEFPSMQQRPWQQYLGNPTWGVGLSFIDFGHEMVGEAVALYPYILIPTVRSKYLDLNFKVAAGLGWVNEHWSTQEDQNPDTYYEPTVTTIFGCHLNAYLNAGLSLNVPITRNVALNGEFGYFHMSNGRTCMPNIGANVLYGGLGVIGTFNSDVDKTPIQFPDQPYKWSLNITAAAGAQKSAIRDDHRFLISTFHTGAIYHVNNWYGVGIGADVFYNDAIDANTDRSLYRKDHVYTTADKIRAGVALNNEFKFGLITAMVDWGVYLYNPARHYYDNPEHPIYGLGRRPLFYKNDGAGSDEAFHYIRFGMKTRIWDNLYFSASAKTHLHICEYVEFGLGYQIPFLKKENRKHGEKIFHHRKNWWQE
ncbi:MAG: acyloxyacyl hydrolase [Bacteroidales bacterium]|nr:acyloxyacyl hydrolase [Bacteroidales bacterium]